MRWFGVGKPVTTSAVELGVGAAAIHNWVRQDQIDWGERSGISPLESIELAKANKRIRQLELGHRQIAAKLVNHGLPRAATTSATSPDER